MRSRSLNRFKNAYQRFDDGVYQSIKRIPATIVVDVVFVAGVLLFGYGAEQQRDGTGALVVGLLLVLYIKPLSWWWRR